MQQSFDATLDEHNKNMQERTGENRSNLLASTWWRRGNIRVDVLKTETSTFPSHTTHPCVKNDYQY